MIARLSLIIVLFFVGFCSHSLTLEEYFQRFETQQTISNIQRNGSSIFMPIENLEYVYSQENSDTKYYHGTDIFKIQLKPTHEMLNAGKARYLADNVRKEAHKYAINSYAYKQHLKAISELLEGRKVDLAEENAMLLEKYFRSLKDLATTEEGSLNRILNLQSKIELLNLSSSKKKFNSSQKERKPLVAQLIGKTGHVLSLLTENSASSINLFPLQKAELKLDQVKNQIDSHSVTNFSTHFEVRNDRVNSETSYRIGIQLPLEVVSDKDEISRAKAMANNAKFQAKMDQTIDGHLQSIKNITTLFYKIKVLNNRIKQLNDIGKSTVQRKAARLNTTARILLFESKVEILDVTLKFYQTSLDLMKDLQLFDGEKSPLSKGLK